jgi:UDP-N-acetylmuramoylalanine--D-glutamate ligase
MKKVATVVGLGVSGAGAAWLLAKKGWEVRVTEGADTPEIHRQIQDLKAAGHIRFETGGHTRGFVEGSSLLVTSPGVKDSAAPIVWAKELGIPVIDEIELGYRFCPARIVAVTGTNGKSTTTTLIGEIFKAAGKEVMVCGNIGVSFCREILKAGKNNTMVLEASSFQLQRTTSFRPHISLFLNITQNHLDRHRNFREYLNAKLNIFRNQTKSDWAVLNHEDRNLKYLNRHIKSRILYFGNSPYGDGAFINQGAVWLTEKGRQRRFIGINEIALKGEHNVNNAMAAILTAQIFRIPLHITASALKRFKGLEHRCEHVADIDGVAFVNDSKATTVDAAIWAIRSFKEPVILIAGGRDKGSDFTVLKPLIEERVKHLVLIGEARAKMKTQLLGSVPIHEAAGLKEAVLLGQRLAKRGEIVLLSPMCASFDMFKNFEERGERFKEAVMELSKKVNLSYVVRSASCV